MLVLHREIKKGATDQTVLVTIRNSSTLDALAALTYQSSGLVCYYYRPGAASPTAISLVTQTVNGAHSDGGFVKIDDTNLPGVYRLDLPDAVCATGVEEATVMLKGVTSMEITLVEIELVTNEVADVMTRLGTPAGASVSADIAAANTDTDALIATLGTPAGADMATDIANAYARLGAPAGASMSADIAAVKAETADILTDTANMQPKLGTPAGASMSADIAAVKVDTAATLAGTGTDGVLLGLRVGMRKNTQFANFMFDMISATTKRPLAGLTVTATRSIDGAAYASCANSVTEVANGTYKITLAAADLNGNNIMLRLTATGAEDTKIHIVTQG